MQKLTSRAKVYNKIMKVLFGFLKVSWRYYIILYLHGIIGEIKRS